MTEKHLEELIQKYAGETANEEEIKQLMTWYYSRPANELRWPGEKKAVYNRMRHRLHQQIKPKGKHVVIFPWQKIAAALLIIVGAGFILLRITKPSAASYVTLTNSSGQIKELRLPDGSQIWLNAETELRYKEPFSKSREIELNGEAYFDVVHDPAHPFVARAGKLQTTVLGTSFNIKSYKQETIATVSLVSGSVQVANNSTIPILLKPSTQLVYNKNNHETAVAAIDTNSVLAWKKGRLQFEGEPLSTIAGSLERWYSVKFVFATPSMKNCRYYMGFDNKLSLERTLAIVAELTGMKYSVANNTVTLSGKGCQ